MALKHVKSCSTSLTHKITEMQIKTKLRYYFLHIRPEKNFPIVEAVWKQARSHFDEGNARWYTPMYPYGGKFGNI